MPKISKGQPKNLRPYIFHGLDLSFEEGDDHARGDCPFCGREGKFYVNIEKGLWDCKICKTGSDKGGGNIYTFLRKLVETSQTTDAAYEALAKDRRFAGIDGLKAWGIIVSPITNDWLVPGYGADGKLLQLYRYLKDTASGRYRLLPTPELGHHLHGVDTYDPKKSDVYLCEGIWDGIALWETMRSCKWSDNESKGQKLIPTSSEAASLLGEANILAVPTCSTFNEPWLPLFADRRVFLMYDNDHARKHPQTGTVVPPAGYGAMKRVTAILATAEQPPREVSYLHWGKDGYDPTLASGFDVRDFLTLPTSTGRRSTVTGPNERLRWLELLIVDKIKRIPSDWIQGRSDKAKKTGSLEIQAAPCTEWSVLINAWRKAMHWHDGLNSAFACMLASITSTEAIGDQLWMKIIGPASCGKSTLCEALAVNKKYILPKSTIRGFHSGWKAGGGDDDSSLLSEARNKTLVTKDGDTLLQVPNLGQVLSEARDIYDRVSRTHYRNRIARDYEGLSMTWLLCGTESLRSLDDSELGERFLDCIIIEEIDDEEEDRINFRVANRTAMLMKIGASTNGSTSRSMIHDGPDLVMAKQLTGGYIDYLRMNAALLYSRIRVTDRALQQCQDLGKFVAYIRARPSNRQEEKAQREMSFRLVSQLVRLAMSIAVVFNKKTTDIEVMKHVNKVALDTARGRTLQIVRHLMTVGDKGMEVRTLSLYTGQTEDKERSLLRFLRKIDVVEVFMTKGTQGSIGSSARPRWRLTDKLLKLCHKVLPDANDKDKTLAKGKK